MVWTSETSKDKENEDYETQIEMEFFNMNKDNFEDLKDDRTGAGFFWDQEVGVIFRKFQVNLPRFPESRVVCIGGQCPEVFIDIHLDNMESLDMDCRSRAYPKYQEEPL